MTSLRSILSLIGYTTERQQLDFVKLMAFRTCFNKPQLPIVTEGKELSIKQKRQKERAERILPIWAEATLQETIINMRIESLKI